MGLWLVWNFLLNICSLRCVLNFNLQVGWGFTTGYDPWLGDDQVRQNQIL